MKYICLNILIFCCFSISLTGVSLLLCIWMAYLVAGIIERENPLKQRGEPELTKERVEFVIDTSNEEDTREFLRIYNIIALSVSLFKEAHFGETTLKISDFGGVTIFSPLKIKEAFEMFYKHIKLDVTFVDSISLPIPADKQEVVLQKLQETYKRTKVKQIEIKREDDADEKKLNEMRNIINTNIEEARLLIEKVKEVISPGYIKKLQESIDDLQKYKMGTNMDKMGSMFQSMLTSMEEVELKYYIELENQEKQQQLKQQIQDMDIVREYEAFKKAEKSKKIKGAVDPSTSFYRSFGKAGIFMRLLFKEGTQKVTIVDQVVYGLFDLAEVFILFLVISFFISTNFFEKSGGYRIMIDLSIVGILLVVTKKIRKKSALQNMGIAVLILLGFIVMKYLIESNFALV